MKKAISVLLSILIVFASFSATTVAFAKAKPIWSVETTKKHTEITITLNGESSSDVEYEQDKENDKKVIITYTGGGTIIDWSLDLDGKELVEGVDYIVISQEGDTIIIELIHDFDEGHLHINVNDVFPDETTKPSKETTTGKRNESQKSPDTGAPALGIGIALAGSAILVATRKKHE